MLFGKSPVSHLADVDNGDSEEGMDHIEHKAVGVVENEG